MKNEIVYLIVKKDTGKKVDAAWPRWRAAELANSMGVDGEYVIVRAVVHREAK